MLEVPRDSIDASLKGSFFWVVASKPDYLDVNLKKMQGVFKATPKLADVPYPVTMEPNLVIEFYSR